MSREAPVFINAPEGQVTNWATLATTKSQVTATNADFAQTVNDLLYFCADATVTTTVKIYHNDGTNSRQIAQADIEVPTIGQNVNLLSSTYLACIDDNNPAYHLPAGHYLEVDFSSTAGIKNIAAIYGDYDPA